MSMSILFGILIAGVAVLAIIYIMLQKKMQEGGKAYEIEKMLSSTKSGGFSMEVFYQKAYNFVVKIPYMSRYLFKIRRRLEILNNNDEYSVRKQAVKVTILSFLATVIIAAILMYINWPDVYMLALSLLGITVLHETMIEVMVNKLEDKILKQELDFFSEVRHYYHEYGMVEEAIYESAQTLSTEISIQGTAIYEILISNDCETELDKYYDVAPNRFLKAFAGISYLTKEYGDRKIDGASLYLKNINNITQELQMEIMKRDKIDYIFQSLTIIAIAPLFVIKILRNWAINTFSITSMFYNAKAGKVVEIIILLMGFLCYNILRRIKENNDRVKVSNSRANKWQEKVYRFPIIEWFVDRLMPTPGSMDYAKQNQLLIDTNSGLKLEWVYVNRIITAIACFCAMLAMCGYLHWFSLNNIYSEATTESASFGSMSEAETKKALELTKSDNEAIKKIQGKYKGKQRLTELEVKMLKQEYNQSHQYSDFETYFVAKYQNKAYTEEEVATFLLQSTDLTNKYGSEEEAKAAAVRILDKVEKINNEYIKPVEIVICIVVGVVGYFVPMLILKFQRKMRELERENEVMQFQTLILMLMRIERISVETILEWLERFANIFKPSISTCVNNFEAGGWKALEQLKDETNYQPFIRIVENLQSAVDKIPILDAFDELESERSFFQEKRKEANERLIAKKSMYGKVIGFAPMIGLFVGYLIVPLIYVSMTFMGEYLSQMSAVM